MSLPFESNSGPPEFPGIMLVKFEMEKNEEELRTRLEEGKIRLQH
jgi:hypothetical protein